MINCKNCLIFKNLCKIVQFSVKIVKFDSQMKICKKKKVNLIVNETFVSAPPPLIHELQYFFFENYENRAHTKSMYEKFETFMIIFTEKQIFGSFSMATLIAKLMSKVFTQHLWRHLVEKKTPLES